MILRRIDKAYLEDTIDYNRLTQAYNLTSNGVSFLYPKTESFTQPYAYYVNAFQEN